MIKQLVALVLFNLATASLSQASELDANQDPLQCDPLNESCQIDNEETPHIQEALRFIEANLAITVTEHPQAECENERRIDQGSLIEILEINFANCGFVFTHSERGVLEEISVLPSDGKPKNPEPQENPDTEDSMRIYVEDGVIDAFSTTPQQIVPRGARDPDAVIDAFKVD